MIPSPQDLGMPAKYKRWRPGQEDAIRIIDESPRSVVGLMLPPGAGKTGIYMGWALWRKKRVCVMAPSKFLQDQIYRDFAGIGLMDLRGQSSPEHVCEINGGLVSDGPCHGGYECPVKHRCSYFVKLRRAPSEQYIVTNPMFWMHNRAVLGDFDALIIDEAHQAFDQIAQRMRITFSKRTVKDYMHQSPTREWKPWASFQKSILGDQLRQLKSGPKNSATYEEARTTRRLHEQVSTLADADPKSLIYQQTLTGWTWDCVWPGAYRSLLTGQAKKYVFTSGTMTRRTMQMLGYRKDEYTWVEFPSSFPVERCPVHILPAPRLNDNSGQDELARWLKLMDLYMDSRKDRRGLIHSGSYDRAEWIAIRSRHGKRMIYHTNSRGLPEALERFLASRNGILVSPAIIEGGDFPYDAARFQIIAKLFFVNPSDPVESERKRQDAQYPWYTVAMKVMQARGRVMRTEDDFGETAICDGSWQAWFFDMASHHFTSYFKDALIQLNGVPKAKPISADARIEQREEKIPVKRRKLLDVKVELSAKSAPKSPLFAETPRRK